MILCFLVLFKTSFIFALPARKAQLSPRPPKHPLGAGFSHPLGANGPIGLAHWVNPQTHWISGSNGPGTPTHWVPLDSLTHWVQLDPLTRWVLAPGVHGGGGAIDFGGRGRADGDKVTATMASQTP